MLYQQLEMAWSNFHVLQHVHGKGRPLHVSLKQRMMLCDA